ncbi:MAG: hypothetical protein ABW221_27140 [Vicinamibacteria bacterium]
MNRSALRLALPVLLLSGAAARAEVNDCTPITSIPTTISTPGVYCLTGDLHLGGGPGTAVTVEGVDGAVIDLNGHTLYGDGNGTALLVRTSKRVTVRNGSLVSFLRAAQLQSTSYNTRLEDLFIAVVGTQPAIESFAWGDVIQRNWIERGNPGIRAYGGASRVSDNDLVSMTSGIDMDGGSNVTVEDNRVSRGSAGAGSYGIRTSGRSMVSRNNVSAFSICFDLSTTTRYRENVTNACTNTYTGGVTAGNNY